jgi:hypothetical protein
LYYIINLNQKDIPYKYPDTSFLITRDKKINTVRKRLKINMDITNQHPGSLSLSCLNETGINIKSNLARESSFAGFKINYSLQEEQDFKMFIEEKYQTEKPILVEKIKEAKAELEAAQEALILFNMQQFDNESKLASLEEKLKRYEEMKIEMPKSHSDSHINKAKEGSGFRKLSFFSKNKK